MAHTSHSFGLGLGIALAWNVAACDPPQARRVRVPDRADCIVVPNGALNEDSLCDDEDDDMETWADDDADDAAPSPT